MLHIYDVSAYQGSALRKCDAAFIKATEGANYTSARFPAQWASAKTQAMLRGAYHFARPEQSSATQQATRFLDVVQPQPGEMLWLDLEASQLSQSATNTWARKFGDELRSRAPGVATGVYMGSGYASNGTGKALNQHYDRWWYSQYPSVYQIAAGTDVEAMRAENRSHATPGRFAIAAMTSSWPASFSPWLPSGLTCGWRTPDIWQFTDNWNGWDASISPLTIEQLAGTAGGQFQEDDMPFAGQIPARKGEQVNISFPRGSLKAVGFVCDNSLVVDGIIAAEPQPEIRYAIHRYDGSWQTGTVKVGSADGGKDHSPKQVIKFTSPEKVDYASFVRLDSGTRSVGWDMS